jgi:hypothetical protein
MTPTIGSAARNMYFQYLFDIAAVADVALVAALDWAWLLNLLDHRAHANHFNYHAALAFCTCSSEELR